MSREFLESLFNLDAQREILDVLRFGRRTNFVQREVAPYMDRLRFQGLPPKCQSNKKRPTRQERIGSALIAGGKYGLKVVSILIVPMGISLNP
jgi:hypothetical protein